MSDHFDTNVRHYDSQFVDPVDLTTRSSSPIAERWGSDEVLHDGFAPVPIFFLKSYSLLKPYPLTTGEAMFALQIMSFRRTNYGRPFPSYKTLANRMGVSEKMARRYAKQLDDKGYISRIPRTSKTNEFDVSGLLRVLARAAKQQLLKIHPKPVDCEDKEEVTNGHQQTKPQ
jgi:DNA-binding MarR family transcriptional regulator